jgi:carboxymethylenebutenolidase
MKYLLAIFALLAAHTALAQDWAKQALQNSPRHRERVTVKHDGRSVETFLA